MQIIIKDGRNQRIGAQPVGGAKNTEELVMAILMTLMLEKLTGKESVTMKIDLTELDQGELQAIAAALRRCSN